jgi:hypothetical protein
MEFVVNHWLGRGPAGTRPTVLAARFSADSSGIHRWALPWCGRAQQKHVMGVREHEMIDL